MHGGHDTTLATPSVDEQAAVVAFLKTLQARGIRNRDEGPIPCYIR
jgi:hypothetical protein